MVDRPSRWEAVFPKDRKDDPVICISGACGERPFQCLAVDRPADLHLTGDSQCFPLYFYDEDGTNRRENITDWALGEFRKHYGRSARKHPSGAKAQAVLGVSGGTTEVVPFQSQGRRLDSKKSAATTEVVPFQSQGRRLDSKKSAATTEVVPFQSQGRRLDSKKSAATTEVVPFQSQGRRLDSKKSAATTEVVPFQSQGRRLDSKKSAATTEVVPFQSIDERRDSGGTTEVVPFQSQGRRLDSKKSAATTEVVPFQSVDERRDSGGTTEVVPFQSIDERRDSGGTTEVVPFQSQGRRLDSKKSAATTEVVPFQSQGRRLDSKKSAATTEVVPFQSIDERRDCGEITKLDIFHYTYGLLHHPEYRTKYAANLKRELPRIPMAPEFKRFAEIGSALMRLHIEYEKQTEYPLERRETGKLDWRVEKMSLSKDKTQLKYNEFLHPTDEDLSVGAPVSDAERDSGGGVRVPAGESERAGVGGGPVQGFDGQAVGNRERSEPGGRSGVHCAAGGAGGYGFSGDGAAGAGVGWVGDRSGLSAASSRGLILENGWMGFAGVETPGCLAAGFDEIRERIKKQRQEQEQKQPQVLRLRYASLRMTGGFLDYVSKNGLAVR